MNNETMVNCINYLGVEEFLKAFLGDNYTPPITSKEFHQEEAQVGWL